MLYTPKSELDSRINKFQALLVENNIQGALIVQIVDLFYFSGTAQNGHLYIPAEGKPVLMVRKSFTRAREESALDNIVPLNSLKKIPQILSEAGYVEPEVLGLELDVLPANNYLLYRNIFEKTKLVDISSLIRKVRQVKSEWELELLRDSGRKLREIYNKIPDMISEGMPEIELASKIEGLSRASGHMGYIYMRAFNQGPFFGHLMSGWTAAVPSAFDGPTGGPGLYPIHPQSGGFKQIKKGEPILVDYSGIWEGYIVDQTRMFSLGTLPDKLQKAFEISIEIQSEIVNKMKTGINGSELHELALNKVAKEGLSDHFMGFVPDQARFVGHGVGLELDELPVLAKGIDTVLENGMVIALEPKFTFPGEGVVGIENTFAITENGIEKLTVTPDELVIIE